MKTAQVLAARAGSGIDPKFFNQVAQFAHFGMMFTVTSVVSLVFRKLGHFHLGLITGFTICFIYAAYHEFWWDPTHEDAETRGSDIEDFIYLLAGSCSAIVILLLCN